MASIVSLLQQDHRTVEKMFSDYQEAQDRAVVAEICDELDVHTRLEEEIVYPALRSDVPEGDGMAEHAEDEHKDARQLIGRIRQTEDPEHLDELVQDLQTAVEEHVTEEENEVLPKMEASLGAERLEQMGAEFEAQKA